MWRTVPMYCCTSRIYRKRLQRLVSSERDWLPTGCRKRGSSPKLAMQNRLCFRFAVQPGPSDLVSFTHKRSSSCWCLLVPDSHQTNGWCASRTVQSDVSSYHPVIPLVCVILGMTFGHRVNKFVNVLAALRLGLLIASSASCMLLHKLWSLPKTRIGAKHNPAVRYCQLGSIFGSSRGSSSLVHICCSE